MNENMISKDFERIRQIKKLAFIVNVLELMKFITPVILFFNNFQNKKIKN